MLTNFSCKESDIYSGTAVYMIRRCSLWDRSGTFTWFLGVGEGDQDADWQKWRDVRSEFDGWRLLRRTSARYVCKLQSVFQSSQAVSRIAVKLKKIKFTDAQETGKNVPGCEPSSENAPPCMPDLLHRTLCHLTFVLQPSTFKKLLKTHF